ncbi:hypothetical protein MNL13_06505 [Bartonella krasnovii]|uniref:Transmembrane protein n=1 Tax=Bartonella krasnovii TaxID=2267275 RepID=A0ABY3VYW4_9HYPH|nr:hypothetical protein [Bartonella krasnovii]UNF28852.1 hypothetical protein MNL13_06505 [Bartonella krasnovii]UNF35222.1 hypothetical protein MNL12_06490 [Bartonella krasnovii]UNF36849.1 hypothetical protein MNL11_07160 [Bartonella krasnovii]UNF41928.1 hypothetical protein MNL08_07120 [Bartonella krasnovii]UNF43586.1 hypothetical protein MNL07_06795 [Bartonella krasnovii]
MRHNGGNLRSDRGKNLRSDQELSDQELRSFSLEEMLLTRKNYKIIFCFAFILEAFKVALILLFKWDLTDWWNYSLFIFILILIVLSVLLFLLIPVAFVVRVIFTHLLKKKIAQLEKVIGPRRKIPS